MPRAVSTVMPAQELAPPAVWKASGGQVSYQNSADQGIVWNVQRILPVRASYARMCPGAEPASSPTRVPQIKTSLYATPGDVETRYLSPTSWPSPSPRSTQPESPKLRIGSPVRASSA